MKLLGIETSCDETGIALYDGDQKKIIFEALYSQAETHSLYGGVVPEIAARDHINRLMPLLKKSLLDKNLSLQDINAIAYTKGPGLRGPLMVGAGFSNALAYSLNIPIIPIHHMEAHLMMAKFGEEDLDFPYVSLLVSGGHTLIVKVESPNQYKILGQTKDDAVGEAFDKTAKLLGLGYPGGPIIEKRAAKGRETSFKFPRPMINTQDYDFSFSGLKTSVLYKVKKLRKENKLSEGEINNIAYEFQSAAIDCLVKKSLKAAKKENCNSLVLSGGVAANKSLRSNLEKNSENLKLFYPELKHCTDNGVMVAYTGYHKLKTAKLDYKVTVKPRWSLEENV